jgi:CheY-like chemotaxis protein
MYKFTEVNPGLGGVRPSILHIDSGRDCRELIAHTLQVGGLYQLAFAEDGRSGLARANELLPDLIVLEYRLPDMDGLDVMFQLRQNVRTHEIPVMVLSAEAHTDVIASCLAAGAVDYITKPFDLHHLWHAIALVANEPSTAQFAATAAVH